MVRVDAVAGPLTALVDPAEWAGRAIARQPVQPMGTGRELFALTRASSDNGYAGAWAMLAAAGL